MNGQRSDFWEVIPGWVKGLAAVVFVCLSLVFINVVFGREHIEGFAKWPSESARIALRIPIGILIGGVLACYILLVGFVNRDAARRGMNSTAWTLIVIFVPNAIGFIIYFLMRQPIAVPCPQCGAMLPQTSNFCPRCAHSLRPTCAQCKHALMPGDVFCSNCGAKA